MNIPETLRSHAGSRRRGAFNLFITVSLMWVVVTIVVTVKRKDIRRSCVSRCKTWVHKGIARG
jgi:hypothetical protein